MYGRTNALPATSRSLLYCIHAQGHLHHICSTFSKLSNLRSIPCHKPKDLIHCPRPSIHHPHPYHHHPSSLLINLPQTPPHTAYPRPNEAPHPNCITPSCKQNQPLITSPTTLQDLSCNRYPSQTSKANNRIKTRIPPSKYFSFAKLSHTHGCQADIAARSYSKEDCEDAELCDSSGPAGGRACEPETEDRYEAEGAGYNHGIVAAAFICHVAW